MIGVTGGCCLAAAVSSLNWKGRESVASTALLEPLSAMPLPSECPRSVARDGIELPPPAFSGPPSKRTKYPGISGYR